MDESRYPVTYDSTALDSVPCGVLVDFRRCKTEDLAVTVRMLSLAHVSVGTVDEPRGPSTHTHADVHVSIAVKLLAVCYIHPMGLAPN